MKWGGIWPWLRVKNMVKSECWDALLVERDEKREKVGVLTWKQPLVQVGKAKESKKPTVSGKKRSSCRQESKPEKTVLEQQLLSMVVKESRERLGPVPDNLSHKTLTPVKASRNSTVNFPFSVFKADFASPHHVAQEMFTNDGKWEYLKGNCYYL